MKGFLVAVWGEIRGGLGRIEKRMASTMRVIGGLGMDGPSGCAANLKECSIALWLYSHVSVVLSDERTGVVEFWTVGQDLWSFVHSASSTSSRSSVTLVPLIWHSSRNFWSHFGSTFPHSLGDMLILFRLRLNLRPRLLSFTEPPNSLPVRQTGSLPT